MRIEVMRIDRLSGSLREDDGVAGRIDVSELGVGDDVVLVTRSATAVADAGHLAVRVSAIVISAAPRYMTSITGAIRANSSADTPRVSR
jgi:hypothetical protein